MDAIISISQLSKHFNGITVVDNLSFDVQRGEVLGFLGPNGAGKSTTMKMITGFLTPSAGQVLIEGMDMQIYPTAAKRLLGYLPEGAPLYADMTVSQFLHFMADIRQLEGNYKKQRLDYAIDKTHLDTVLHQTIDTLSKGFKRRVGLAQAILHDPAILILDEPTDGLDPNQKQEVRQLLAEIASEKAIIISTHLLEEVDAICTRALIIAGGKLIKDSSPQALRSQSPSGRLDDLFRQLTSEKQTRN